ncbi:hypothetical protein NPIL_379971 [Nephila pilipes]|uniref:Uncharacterized protein n=1 Tax=Nephila pilipes TaxID=299642 RepID=A0A8X6MRD3_NEPPI|nr:hypothetical protein NPIL_379971 [Nephila pilipes]
MGLVEAEDLRILDIKQMILNSKKYEENSIKNLLMNITEERIEKNKEAEQIAEQEGKKDEIDFELQKRRSIQENTLLLPIRTYTPYAQKRSSPDRRFEKTNHTDSTSSFSRGDKLKTEDKSERSSVSCYGCSNPGVTKLRCPNCKPTANEDSSNFSNISLFSCFSNANQCAVLKLAVNGKWGTACADTGASHTIAGENLYLFLYI